jgi:hypothetical protein
MWYPSQAELIQANLITGVADGHQFAASGYGASISRERFDAKFKSVPLFYALQKSNPKVYDDFIH